MVTAISSQPESIRRLSCTYLDDTEDVRKRHGLLLWKLEAHFGVLLLPQDHAVEVASHKLHHLNERSARRGDDNSGQKEQNKEFLIERNSRRLIYLRSWSLDNSRKTVRQSLSALVQIQVKQTSAPPAQKKQLKNAIRPTSRQKRYR